jgi:hypothetical protein
MSDRRIAAWLGCASFLFFLLFHHGHFKGSDEIAVFEMTRSLWERGDLAVPPLRHTEVGADGRRYSYFAPAGAVLALPLYALATPARAVLPDIAVRALAGPVITLGPHRFGGELEVLLVGLSAPLIAALLVGLFYLFERELGVAPVTAALVAAALATSTHTGVLANYFLRHTTEAVLLLGALLAWRRFTRGAGLAALALGSALASTLFLVRVPSAIAAPALAGYLVWVLHARDEWRAGPERLARVLAVVLLPLAVALAIHAGVNHVQWGTWLASPMVEQESRFNSPLWRGLAGLLVSPGSSVFVYSPLLALAPFGLAALWRRDLPLALASLALAATFLLFYARFDGWSGLWSAPGPRYLFVLVPVLLLPLGLWLDAPDAAESPDASDGKASRMPRSRRLALAGVLAALGFFVQLVSTVVRWGSVQALADYPALSPDQSDFLFQLSRAPAIVMTGLLASGGPLDSWLWNLWHGWEGFAGRPGAVIVLLIAWAAALGFCTRALVRALRPRSEAA